jgi:hypothetical protein
MPSVARRLALALAPALIDVISLALFRMHLPTKIAIEAELQAVGTVPLYRGRSSA